MRRGALSLFTTFGDNLTPCKEIFNIINQLNFKVVLISFTILYFWAVELFWALGALTHPERAGGSCCTCDKRERDLQSVYFSWNTRRSAWRLSLAPINSLLKNSRTPNMPASRAWGGLLPALLFMHDLIFLGHKTDPSVAFFMVRCRDEFARGTDSSRPKSRERCVCVCISPAHRK